MEGRAYAGGVDPGKVFLRKYLMVRGRATFASAIAATPSLKRTRFLFLFCPLRTDDRCTLARVACERLARAPVLICAGGLSAGHWCAGLSACDARPRCALASAVGSPSCARVRLPLGLVKTAVAIAGEDHDGPRGAAGFNYAQVVLVSLLVSFITHGRATAPIPASAHLAYTVLPRR